MHPTVLDRPDAVREVPRPTLLQIYMTCTHLTVAAQRINAAEGDAGCEFAEAYRAVAAWMEAQSS